MKVSVSSLVVFVIDLSASNDPMSKVTATATAPIGLAAITTFRLAIAMRIFINALTVNSRGPAAAAIAPTTSIACFWRSVSERKLSAKP